MEAPDQSSLVGRTSTRSTPVVNSTRVMRRSRKWVYSRATLTPRSASSGGYAVERPASIAREPIAAALDRVRSLSCCDAGGRDVDRCGALLTGARYALRNAEFSEALSLNPEPVLAAR
jgi:hypothetical protein